MIEVNESNRPREEEIEIALLTISRQFPNCEIILRAALIALDQDLKDAISAYDEIKEKENPA